MITTDTPAGAQVPCEGCPQRPHCRNVITMQRAVSAAEHALAIWTCDDCIEEIHPGHRAEVAAEDEHIRKLSRKGTP